MKSDMRSKERGITVVEWLIMVSIIAVCVAIAVPNFLGGRQRSWDSRAKKSGKRMELKVVRVGERRIVFEGFSPYYPPVSHHQLNLLDRLTTGSLLSVRVYERKPGVIGGLYILPESALVSLQITEILQDSNALVPSWLTPGQSETFRLLKGPSSDTVVLQPVSLVAE